jgi:hypothetical protein
VSFVERVPESQTPSTEVDVCGTPLCTLDHVRVAPTGSEISAGAKAKESMLTVPPEDGGVCSRGAA